MSQNTNNNKEKKQPKANSRGERKELARKKTINKTKFKFYTIKITIAAIGITIGALLVQYLVSNWIILVVCLGLCTLTVFLVLLLTSKIPSTYPSRS